MFFQWLVGAYNKENIKAVHHLPFVRVICSWQLDSPHKGLMMQKALPCRDIIIQLQLIFIKDLERKLLGEICSWLDQHWFHYGWIQACYGMFNRSRYRGKLDQRGWKGAWDVGGGKGLGGVGRGEVGWRWGQDMRRRMVGTADHSTYLPMDKMSAISQTTYSNAFF